MKTKRALVTGGAKRLGKEIALYLAANGHDVAVHYSTSKSEAADVVTAIKSMGRNAVALQADFLDEEQTLPLVGDAARALGGPISVLINNASIFEHDDIHTADRDSWDRHIGSNLRAPFVLTQEFAKALKSGDEGASRRGLVINMLDQRVLKLTPEFMSYTIAKMGLWAFTQTAARALGPNIRVNAIGPGTTLIGENQSQEHFEAQRNATVLGMGADPNDITAALGYFLDAQAVTGQLLCVDGGQHLSWRTEDIIGSR